MKLEIYIINALLLPALVASAPLEDKVLCLPEYGQPPTPQFSGFLNATEGCDTEANGAYCHLHYWLALAEGEDPFSKPLILWLNGGPGASSLLGFLQENGPLLVDAIGGLLENPWSWTKVANLLALEAPVGVGFSYCQNQMVGKPCNNTDDSTASASRAALQDFFHKFKELATSDFFITGESYAGVYIPTLAKEILDKAPEIKNFKGVAVGDPCTDMESQDKSMNPFHYSYKNGLIDANLYDDFVNQCNATFPLFQDPIFEPTLQCNATYRKILMSTSDALSQGWPSAYIDDYSLFTPVSSKADDDTAAYLSRSDVQKALNVQDSPVSNWSIESAEMDYHKQYAACNANADPQTTPSMIDFYQVIAPKLNITWIYNGDADPAVPFEGTRAAVENIGYKEVNAYRPWFYTESAAPLDFLAQKPPTFGPDLQAVVDLESQFGGEVINYEHGLAFLTVHGSGHMVPQYRPQAALHMIARLVEFQDLSPPCPSDQELGAMSQYEFMTAMDVWTETAKSHPYATDPLLDEGDNEQQTERKTMQVDGSKDTTGSTAARAGRTASGLRGGK